MKRLSKKVIAFLLSFYLIFSVGCPPGENPEPTDGELETNESSIIPSGNDFVGCVEISSHTAEVFLRTYISNNTGLEFSVSSNAESNIYSENIGSATSAERRDINFPDLGYNYLCIEPIVFPSGFTEYTLIVSIGGIDRLVTLHPGVTSCIDVIVESDGIFCPGNGTESDEFGKVEFWTDNMLGCIDATLTVDGEGPYTLTSSLSSAPNCLDTSNQGVVIDIIPGSHSYTVTNCNGLNKSGTFNVNVDACTIININDASSGGSGTGDLIFWTNTLLDSGPFTVTVDGVGSQQVAGYFTNVPDCNDASQGGLFENLPVGVYSFTISDFPSANGTYNITVVEDQCTQVDFNL